MKPTLKIYLKPRFKIGTLVWGLAEGFCMADYFQNPTDEKIIGRKVIGYNIVFRKGKAQINGYFLEGGGTAQEKSYWDFASKKEMLKHLRTEMLKSYKFGRSFKNAIEKLVLTPEEKLFLNK